MMTIDEFIRRLDSEEGVTFEETMDLIESHYDFTPTAFTNGPGDAAINNAADENQGSCKVFAFGKENGLTKEQALACFGQHYRDVLADPGGSSHGNIRSFMRHGWDGIVFSGSPLAARKE